MLADPHSALDLSALSPNWLSRGRLHRFCGPQQTAYLKQSASLGTDRKNRHFAQTALGLVVCGCITTGLLWAQDSHATDTTLTAGTTKNLLYAEIALDRDQTALAKQLYTDLALTTADPAVLERALALRFDPGTQGSAADSLKLVVEFERLHPSFVPAWFYKAHLAFLVEDYELAAETLNKILRFNPQADLGQILEGITPKDSAQSASILRALANLDSSNASILFLRSALSTQNNQPDQALQLASAAIDAQPGSLALVLHKARLLERKDPEQGADFLKKMSKKLSQYPVLALEASRVLIRDKQLDAAYGWLKKSVVRYPNDSEIRLLAGLIGLETKHFDQSINWLSGLTKEFSYADQAQFYMALAYLGKKNSAKAVQSFSQVRGGEFYLKAQKQMLDLWIKAGQLDQATQKLNQLKQSAAYRDWATAQQILLLQRTGNPDRALVLARQASETSDDAQVLSAYLKVLPQQRVIERWSLYERILTSDPDDEKIMSQYSSFLLDQAQKKDSPLQSKIPALLDQLEEMLIYQNSTPENTELLIKLYLAQNKPEQAADLMVQLYFESPNPKLGQLLYDTLVSIKDFKAAQLIAQDMLTRF